MKAEAANELAALVYLNNGLTAPLWVELLKWPLYDPPRSGPELFVSVTYNIIDGRLTRKEKPAFHGLGPIGSATCRSAIVKRRAS